MLLFKTSAQTLPRVIELQKHAFAGRPRKWHTGELVLISKNRRGLRAGEKQIQHTMRIVDIRRASDEELNRYWPGNSGRWRYVVDCEARTEIVRPFDLSDVPGVDDERYRNVVTYAALLPEDEARILSWLKVP